MVATELKKTSVQSTTLKPTFQSNFINTPSQVESTAKLVHNSIGSPIVQTQKQTLSTTVITNKTTNETKEHASNDHVPEWKRTLLEKKKMKKNF